MTLVLCYKCPREISDGEPACPECGVLEREGAFEQHYESGQLMARGTYLNSALHGSYEEYYESGQLEGKYNFENGDPRGDGLFEYYNERGELMARGSYYMSKKCGEWFVRGAGWSGRDKVEHYPSCPESQD